MFPVVIVVVFCLFLLLLGFLSEENATVLNFSNMVVIFRLYFLFLLNTIVIDALDILLCLVFIKLSYESKRGGKSLYRSCLSVKETINVRDSETSGVVCLYYKMPVNLGKRL